MYTYLYILSEEDPEDNMSARAVVVITFSKADAERLRLIKREFQLTSD